MMGKMAAQGIFAQNQAEQKDDQWGPAGTPAMASRFVPYGP